MKVGCLHSNTQVDQHLCRFNAVSLDRDSRHNGPDAGEHFAADLPGIVSSTPRIGHLGTGKCPADGIHYLTTHRFTLGLGSWLLSHGHLSSVIAYMLAPLGSDSTIFTPTSYNAMRSRGYAHSREHACCPSPSRRDVPRTPSAHACNAGACATILKAFFDADYVLPHPVEATPD